MPVSGEVIYFDAERGIGFASGADGNRYVFDRDDLDGLASVSKGTRITFRADGDHARDIVVPSAKSAVRAVHAVPVAGADEPAAEAQPARGLFGYFRYCASSGYARFRGRARRKEYWGFALFSLVSMMVVGGVGLVIDGALGNLDEPEPSAAVTVLCAVLLTLALLLPSLAVTVRRLHDIGLSGWFLLLWLIPSIGPLIVLVFTLIPSQKHDNKWGPVPAGIAVSRAR